MNMDILQQCMCNWKRLTHSPTAATNQHTIVQEVCI